MPPEGLAGTLGPERLASLLRFLSAAFLAAVPLLALRAAFHFAPYRIGRPAGRLALFPALFCIGLLAILAHQATWQLLGFVRPAFVGFLERYDPRPEGGARSLIRGSILDRAGRVLAYTEEDGSGRRSYPYAEAAAHVVGLRNPRERLTGIEEAADPLLSGYHELKTSDDFRAAGRVAMQAERRVGTNVTLSIDARLQL
ncbi:MAG: hypothetical protein IJ678_03165, partial [Kiritimatiellae bacterium]|nr:hypothetical protein [Kiritimatiellia bacterium]